MRAWWALLLTLFLMLVPQPGAAEMAWLQFDDPPDELAGDVDPGLEAADLVDLFVSPTYTDLYLREDLNATPDPVNVTYVVFMDNLGAGGWFDWRVVYDDAGAVLEERGGFSWSYVQDVNMTEDVQNRSLVFEVPIDVIGGIDDIRIAFWNYDGSPYFWNLADAAPDSGAYTIPEETIPNLPGLVLPAFAGGLVASVLVLFRRRLVR